MSEETKKAVEEEEVSTAGWDAITEAFEKVYPGQTDPKHFGSIVPWRLGGPNPIQGISVYETDEYYHFVTYGLSELYEKETDDPEWSGYGMEFTMKLKKSSVTPDEEDNELKCICNILSMVAKITFEKGELFLPNEYIYTRQTTGIDFHQTSKLTGFILVADTSVPPIDTPNGKVEFVEFVGCTDAELLKIYNKEITVEELYAKIGSDLTNYKRESLF